MEENNKINITEEIELSTLNTIMHKIIAEEKDNLKKTDNTKASDRQMVDKIVNIVEREIR